MKAMQLWAVVTLARGGSAISSARLYWDNAQKAKGGLFDARGIKIPVAVKALRMRFTTVVSPNARAVVFHSFFEATLTPSSVYPLLSTTRPSSVIGL
jgi:hypothetical protein